MIQKFVRELLDAEYRFYIKCDKELTCFVCLKTFAKEEKDKKDKLASLRKDIGKKPLEALNTIKTDTISSKESDASAYSKAVGLGKTSIYLTGCWDDHFHPGAYRY
jgi:hypothetical protein